ncbi:MAG: hypothetical protein JST29_08110 [Bacteroidetes bacterium]|nr:hypothetical protein [Bacteroidota bacterium]MBS1590971.1 hypothetical protein [Bacteroidota bacterium]
MKNLLFVFIIFILFTVAGCSGCKNTITPTLDNPNGLPPATQEGKNTFGFLLNGQPWTPQGYNGGISNLSLYYDENFSAGVFNLSTYKINSTGLRQHINFYGDSIQFAQKILLPNPGKFGIVFSNNDTSLCSSYDLSDASVKIESGFFDIKKIDKNNHIFSGEFEIKVVKNGCAVLNITEGRFDMKY